MRAVWTERIAITALAVLIIGGLVWFAWPQPTPVDLAPVTRGSMEVTVDDDAKTHVRHIYTIYAPIAGTVLRISHPHGETGISRHVGDQVTANETVVALMQPATPGFVDIRSREELQQAVAAADAAVKEEEAEIRRLQAAVVVGDAVDHGRQSFQIGLPAAVFIAEQIDALPESIEEYLAAERNRQRHVAELQDRLGFRPFGTRPAADLAGWLLPHAIENDRLRDGLSAVGRRIRTFRPSQDHCFSELVEPCAGR